MKTIACDICGRTREDLFGYLPDYASIYRFKASRWDRFCQQVDYKDIDVCGLCLKDLREKNRKKGEQNGND